MIVGTLPLTTAQQATAAPTAVTLVGTFQTEIGCTSDWQTECTNGDLTPVSGGTWASELTLPAGDYEFKTVIGHSFAESYGIDGAEGGENIPLSLAGQSSLRFTYDENSHRMSVTPLDLPGEYSSADDAIVGDPVRQSGTDEQFYFVMTDRFANGDAANDQGGLSGDANQTGFDPTHKGYFHGGDLAGLQQKLDYIEGLGTTAIWLTPSFVNKPVQGTGDQASAGYHGYWITDFTQIDPHLGSNAEMQALIAAAHAKGMKVYFDIITNHTADVIQFREGPVNHDDPVNAYITEAESPYKDPAGNPFNLHEAAVSASQGNPFPSLSPTLSFPKTPFIAPEDANAKTPAWLNDVTNYHNRGNAHFDGGESDTQGDFSGLDDLMTEKPEVVDGFVDVYKAWIDLGIDGFRIDTVKHVNSEFWQQWSPAIMDYAQSVGRDEFYMFGEVYDGNPKTLSSYVTEAKLPGVLDFGFQGAATNYAKGGSAAGMSQLFAGDDYYTTASTSAHAEPTFLGNHDMGRIGMFVSDQSQPLERDEFAHSLMYLTRGQPVIYYGDEQGFTGTGGDQDARQDMFATQVASYADQQTLTGANGGAEHFDQGNQLYTHIAELAQLRANNGALSHGAQIERYVDNGAGVYAFSRVDRDEKVEHLVAVNNSAAARTVTIPALTPSARLNPLYGTDAAPTTGADGTVSVTVPAFGAVVFAADTPLPSAVVDSTDVMVPQPGAKLADRAEVTAAASTAAAAGAYSETSFAYRLAGTADWVPLGTDDDGKPRVFHSTAGLKPGALVEYRAVTVDLSGHATAASSYGFVGVNLSEIPTDESVLVTIPGSLNEAMGCGGNWQPDCAKAALVRDPLTGIYSGTFDLPVGSYEYKVAVGGSWSENYGAKGIRDGANLEFSWTGGPVTFVYNPETHYVTSTAQPPIVVLAGSFQSQLGCVDSSNAPADWQPGCLGAWMTDVNGTGTYTFSTGSLAAGSYEVKVVHGLSWDENYGADGVRGGSNIQFTVEEGKQANFTYTIADHRLQVTSTDIPVLGTEQSRAYWVDQNTLAFPAGDVPKGLSLGNAAFTLGSSATAQVVVSNGQLTGGVLTTLRYAGQLSADQVQRFPALQGYLALKLDDVNREEAAALLSGQLVVSLGDKTKQGPAALAVATGVQTAGVLEDLYAEAATDLTFGTTFSGNTPSFRLWAPTAQQVTLLTWENEAATGEPMRTAMTRDEASGSWAVTGTEAMNNQPYRYELSVYEPIKAPKEQPAPEGHWGASGSTGAVNTIEVTDPASTGLTINSTHSVAVDLADASFKPQLWTDTQAPTVEKAVEQSIYELHVRDFSLSDATVPEEHRGSYLAFTDADSDGMQHLRSLADAGLTTVHLLPTFDIASIEEDRSQQSVPQCDLAALTQAAGGSSSSEQQACIAEIAATDGFNWGYDPLHFDAPEGSYAVDAYGGNRVAEFRSMVGGLHDAGLQVVLDQVFNHTAAAGPDPQSIFDRVVPGYYQRLDSTGKVENSTCCENVATEHAMAGKVMVDSVVTWARDYHVDGFRFDLMGHHSTQNMADLRAALDELTLERDGVDGSSIYLYGEGWNFGEVANNRLFTQASQGNLGGTGIGTFSDRLRDGVRGGGTFGQGLMTGQQDAGAQLSAMNLIQLGMAGNLADYSFTSATNGQPILGKNVLYNGSPGAGYAQSPEEVISYVDAHDNETLFDALTEKLPTDTPMSDKVRLNTLALASTALGQSPLLWHAGTDMLRSKSLDKDSYNSGDWFNEIDWTGQDNGFGRGLPPANRNEQIWAQQAPLLANPELKPSAEDIAAAASASADLLRLRYSTPLFTLGDAGQIQQKVTFPQLGGAAVPGVIAMWVDDTVGADADPMRDGVLVLMNTTAAAQSHVVDGLAGQNLSLSSIQSRGDDATVKQTEWDAGSGSITVPAYTVAVLDALAEEVPVIAPNAPVLNPSDGTHLGGTADRNTTITVYEAETMRVLGSATTTATGTFDVAFEPALASGTEVLVTAKNEIGTESVAVPLRIGLARLVVTGEQTHDATVRQGEQLSVSGIGFQPGEDIVVELHSDVVTLGTAQADGEGAFVLIASIATSQELGAHTVFARGAESGEITAAVEVLAAEESNGGHNGGGNSGGSGNGGLPGSNGSGSHGSGTASNGGATGLAVTGASSPGGQALISWLATALLLAGVGLAVRRRRSSIR
nr:pullulanase-type alpha-1,6-glucosidase [Lysinibacter cavernae]